MVPSWKSSWSDGEIANASEVMLENAIAVEHPKKVRRRVGEIISLASQKNLLQ
jgi:hypothetical protein